MRRECPLGLRGRNESVGCARESKEKSVTLGVDLDSAVSRDGLAEEEAMVVQDFAVPLAKRSKQARRSLDVCEEER
jgi:hypothetical protein